MLTTVKAYYDGTAFVPMDPMSLQTGKVLAFRQITTNLRKIEEEDPLPSEFDEILSHRLNFKHNI